MLFLKMTEVLREVTFSRFNHLSSLSGQIYLDKRILSVYLSLDKYKILVI